MCIRDRYICPPESNVYHIPDHLSLREAALAEPLSCCLHGMDLLDVKLGDVVVVIGMGMIGSMMVKLCSIAGASHIIVIAVSYTHLDVYKRQDKRSIIDLKNDKYHLMAFR